MFVEKFIACPIIQNPKLSKLTASVFLYKKIVKRDVASFGVFWSTKYFLLIGHQSSPKKPIMQPAESHRVFWF